MDRYVLVLSFYQTEDEAEEDFKCEFYSSDCLTLTSLIIV